MHQIPALTSPDEARGKLRPWLDTLRLRPTIEVRPESPGLPTVEWRCAKDRSGRDLLFLLNMGHTPTKVRILRAGRPVGRLDLICRKPVGPSHTLASPEVRLMRLENDIGGDPQPRSPSRHR